MSSHAEATQRCTISASRHRVMLCVRRSTQPCGIAMMPTSCIFQRGHSIELIVRNQDDMLSRLGLNGVYFLPFMRTVTHTIYFGKSHLVLPIIPGKASEISQK